MAQTSLSTPYFQATMTGPGSIIQGSTEGFDPGTSIEAMRKKGTHPAFPTSWLDKPANADNCNYHS